MYKSGLQLGLTKKKLFSSPKLPPDLVRPVILCMFKYGWTFRGCASGCGTTTTTSKFLGVVFLVVA